MVETSLVQQCEKDDQENVQYDPISIITIVSTSTVHNYSDFVIKDEFDRNTALMNHLIAVIMW